MKIFKLFTYLVLSFCMLNLQLTPTFLEFAQVQAQTTINQQQTNTENTTNTSITSAADNVDTKTFKGEDAGSMGTFMSVLTMIIIGFVSMKFIQKCGIKGVPIDVMIAAAGGAAYIGAEIMELFNRKEEIKNRKIKYTVNDFGAVQEEDQVQALIEERKAYQSMKESAENKSKFQKAASAAFFAAAGTALSLHMARQWAYGTCAKGAAAIATSGSGSVACGKSASFATAKQIDELSVNPNYSIAEGQGDTTLAQTLTQCPACSFVPAIVVKSQAMCTPKSVASNQFFTPKEQYSFNESFLEQAMSLLIPKAQASMTTLLGGLGGGLATAYLLKGTIDDQVDKFLGRPLKRSILFGGLGALSMMTAQTTANVADTMQKNIDKIDAILRRYDAFNQIQSIRGNLGRVNQVNLPQNLAALNTIGTKNSTFPCSVQTSNGNCASMSNLIKDTIKKDNLKIDPFTVSALDNLGKVSDGLSGKTQVSSETLSAAESLGSAQGALSNRLARMRAKVNSDLKKLGKKPIAFKSEEDKMLGGMKATLLKNMNKKGQNPQSLLASISPMNTPEALSANAANEQDLSKASETAAVENAQISAKNSGTAAAAGTQFKFDSSGMELEDLDANKEILALESATQDADNAEMAVVDEDINKDSTANLFKIITVRYFKSYNRIFDKKDNN